MKDLQELSGEDQVKAPPKFVVPIIKLDGEKNGYNIISKDEKEGLGEFVDAVVLKVRRSITGFTDEISYYSKEHDNWNEEVSLIERRTTDKGMKKQAVDKGTYKQLKEKWGKVIRLNMVLYVWLIEKEMIAKIIVSGKGCNNLYDYFGDFDSNEHIYEYITKFGSNEETNERLRKTYYAVNFTKAGKVEDMEFIGEKIREVAGSLEKIDRFYKEKEKSYDDAELGELPEEKEDSVKETLEDDPEIKVEDIPF